MSHPPQPNYHQYAMRPGPGYAGGPPGGYPPQGPPQDAGRYYTPAPQGTTRSQHMSERMTKLTAAEPAQYPTSSPSPNFHRQGAPSAAPFYVAGAEVPSEAGQRPIGSAPPTQQYPPRDQTPRLPSTGKAPAPINTSPPPPANAYTAYAPPVGAQRPQSTYGAQELATSVYDSPIAPHNPNSAATYSSSVYSPDDPYNSASPGPGGPAGSTVGGVAPPAAYAGVAPQYHSYQPPPSGPGYDGAAPSGPPPPVPTGSAPPIPGSQGGRPLSVAMSPPPLHPTGSAYDARQSLPSQMAGPPGPGQYKPYVPPIAEGPGAPSAPPSDYYRSSGNVY